MGYGQSDERRHRRREQRFSTRLFLIMLAVALAYGIGGTATLQWLQAPPVLSVLVASAAVLSVVPSFIYWRKVKIGNAQ